MIHHDPTKAVGTTKKPVKVVIDISRGGGGKYTTCALMKSYRDVLGNTSSSPLFKIP